MSAFITNTTEKDGPLETLSREQARQGETSTGGSDGSTETLYSLLRMASGETSISAAFLSSVLPDGDVAPVVTFSLDEGSVIEGRHSTTFKLLLNRSRRTEITGLKDHTGGTQFIKSVFVKRVICAELPKQPLSKLRTNIASYRAEATFFKTLAGCRELRGLVPRAFWVHIDDRLGHGPAWTRPIPMLLPRRPSSYPGEANGTTEEEEEKGKDLRKSSFIIIMEDIGGATEPGWEQAGALNLERARLVLAAAAHVHASFWPRPSSQSSSSATAARGEAPLRDANHAHSASVACGGYGGEGGNAVGSDTASCSEGRNEADATGVSRNMEGVIRAPVEPESAAGGDDGDTGRDIRDCAESGRSYPQGLHEQGTFWSLEKRYPGDLPGLEEEYRKLLQRFRRVLPEAWFEGEKDAGVGGGLGRRRRREASLGRRISARALQLDAAVRGVGNAANDRRSGRTLIHGDLKTWNVFIRKELGESGEGGAGTMSSNGVEEWEESVKFIDWQWCGEGLAAADVAYVVCTSLEPALLSSEAQLLAYYHAELSTRLEKRLGPPPGNPVAGDSSSLGGDRDDGGVPADAAAVKGGAAGASWYPFEEFMEDYRVAFLDYVRCVLGTLWKGLTPEKMERNRSAGPGMSLINRSEHHLRWIIEKATNLLDELDRCEEGEEEQAP